ncbi:Glycerate dehydrogenase [Roseivivax jejudonensis]|uniref:Glycerate dehydrogenase n=1 Tax=Roseivivax jejudonensis TaxID=1529041 RepID=A0A1X6ZTL9_9RHOB|nr:D-glycerate dehydrogenase [Roseivivax jejudonensis]SLN61361.1 Glycerate dehydrogenase [Roseivivax jejudonensis]
MAKPRILLTRAWPEAVEARLARDYDAVLNREDTAMGTAEIGAALAEFDAVCPTVSDRLPAEIFTGGHRARILGNFGVGVNHIAVDAARTAGIEVTNTPGVLTDCTADLALTLMLMLARRAGEGEREVRAGRWSGWRPTHMIGARLSGKTLGIVGMGRIGLATARRAQAGFGMRVVYYNRSPVPAESLAGLDAARLDTVDQVMTAADVVSLHVPGGAGTAGLIDAERLALLGPEGFLVNTARGDVVDEAALVAALEAGAIAGAGLDVYADEPRVPEALTRRDDVVLLPHLGSATRETREAMGHMVADTLDAVFAGRDVPNRVG